MKLSFWSDEDRWLVQRAFGLGYSLNLKYVAKRLGWIKSSPSPTEAAVIAPLDAPRIEVESREDRLKKQIQASRFEDER